MAAAAAREEEYKRVVRAVEGGDNAAKTRLAWFKLAGLWGCAVDEDGAVALLEERVKDRDGTAMWMLGLCCEYGMGIEQDVERAEELYRECSKGGDAIGKWLAGSGRGGRGNGKVRKWGCRL